MDVFDSNPFLISMKNYLSIGELAKIRNLDVQSLRYYEKLGILVPAYVNPKSGYRYYKLEQVMTLDTILLCINLGIPLKKLRLYVDASGQLALEQLLSDGLSLANERRKKLDSEIRFIQRTLQHIDAQKPYLERDGSYVRHIFARDILTLPCDRNLDPGDYEKGLSRLFQLAEQHDLQASFPHGMLFTYENGTCMQSCLFVEVSDKDQKMARRIPEGDYCCLKESRERHSPPDAVFPADLFAERTVDVIVSSVMPETCRPDSVTMEFQMPLDGRNKEDGKSIVMS